LWEGSLVRKARGVICAQVKSGLRGGFVVQERFPPGGRKKKKTAGVLKPAVVVPRRRSVRSAGTEETTRCPWKYSPAHKGRNEKPADAQKSSRRRGGGKEKKRTKQQLRSRK